MFIQWEPTFQYFANNWKLHNLKFKTSHQSFKPKILCLADLHTTYFLSAWSLSIAVPIPSRSQGRIVASETIEWITTRRCQIHSLITRSSAPSSRSSSSACPHHSKRRSYPSEDQLRKRRWTRPLGPTVLQW